MMIWLRWVFSPVGRTVAAIGAFFAILFAAYLKGRKEGTESLRQEQADERERRLNNSLEADRRARERINRGGLLENDGHRRD